MIDKNGIEWVEMYNASSETLRVSFRYGPEHSLRFNETCEPFGKMDIPKEHTVMRQDNTGKLIRPPLISELAPHLVPAGDKRYEEAKALDKSGKYKRTEPFWIGQKIEREEARSRASVR